jgi:methionyl-tRNA formyltransferase
MLKKSDGELDFSKSAQEIARTVRAFNPWPGTYTDWNGKILKIHKAHALDHPSPGSGVRMVHQNQPTIGTSDGVIVLDQVQPAGKKNMSGEAFLRGAKNWQRSSSD